MADSYSIEERLVASVWVHERQHTGQTVSQVLAAFWERFNKAPPRYEDGLEAKDWRYTARITSTCLVVKNAAPTVCSIQGTARQTDSLGGLR